MALEDLERVGRWLPDALVVLSAEGHVQWANGAAERLFGWPVQDWAGANAFDLIHADDVSFGALSLLSVQHKVVGAPIQVRVRAASGWRRVEVVGGPLPSGDVVLSLRDVGRREQWQLSAGDPRVTALLDAAPALTLLLSIDGKVESASGALARILHLDPEFVSGRFLMEFVGPSQSADLREAFVAAVNLRATSSNPVQVEVDLIHQDGHEIPFELNIAALLEDPSARGLVVSGHDLSRLRTAQKDVIASERRFRSVIENSSDVVTLLDASGKVLYESPAMHRILGHSLADRLGRWALDLVHPNDLGTAQDAFASVLDGDIVQQVQLRVRRRDGSYIWVDASARSFLDDEAIGAIVVNFRDVTEAKRLEQELQHQAFHDSLTGLANRLLLLDRLEQATAALQRSPGTIAALLVLDLDDFKTANDALGHAAGDVILAAVARRISGVLRPGDTAARLGGDEFAVLLPAIEDAGAACEIGYRIAAAIEEPIKVSSSHITVSASVGVAVVDASGLQDVDDLVRNADLAMYRAKRDGKASVALYDPGLFAAVIERMTLTDEIRRGLDRDEFRPHYQPVVDLSSGAVIGVEALVRWYHPERGVLAPRSFIGVAEATGLIRDIGRKMLIDACAASARWRVASPTSPSTVSVNVAPAQAASPELVTDVERALTLSGIPPSALVLEITETALISDTVAAAKTLRALKALGVRIALDDFGTGYSSMSYLDSFPVDIVKLDKSFIDGLADGRDEAPLLVRSLITFLLTLGLDIIAEGVEDQTQAERLRAYGCASAQGYLFSHPLDEADFLSLLGASSR